ncbi:unnamed protein product [Xylocopa violacea]|uniref:Uncharacterized protein n=1 Tax=Xylocopa violacea TaxID=135666 RepID=A0ABP1MZK8_XYLVO
MVSVAHNELHVERKKGGTKEAGEEQRSSDNAWWRTRYRRQEVETDWPTNDFLETATLVAGRGDGGGLLRLKEPSSSEQRSNGEGRTTRKRERMVETIHQTRLERSSNSGQLNDKTGRIPRRLVQSLNLPPRQ